MSVPDEQDQRTQSNPQGNHDLFRKILCPDQVEIQGGVAVAKSPQDVDVVSRTASPSKEEQADPGTASGGDVVLATASPPDQPGGSDSIGRFGSASLESGAASTKMEDAGLAPDEPMHQAAAKQFSASETSPLVAEASSPVGGVLSTSSASEDETLAKKEQARRAKYSRVHVEDFSNEKSIGQLVEQEEAAAKETLDLWSFEPAECRDRLEDRLVCSYIWGMVEIGNWRANWDGQDIDAHRERASKGHSRLGPGKGVPYDYDKEYASEWTPVPWQKSLVNHAEMIDWAQDRCGIQEKYWCNSWHDAQGSSGHARFVMFRKLVTAKTGKKYFTFVYGPW